MDHDFRLLRRDGGAVWVNLRAEILSTRQGATVFRGVFLDIDRLRREGQDLQAALSRRETALRDAETLLDRMPVGLCLLRRRPDGGVELLRANQVLSRLLGLSPAALARRLAEDPGSGLPTGEREELLAAAVRSRECGLPLRRACRVCLGGGRELCLSPHVLGGTAGRLLAGIHRLCRYLPRGHGPGRASDPLPDVRPAVRAHLPPDTGL